MKFRFAHISDLHLPPLPAVRPREVVNKRFLGWLSWHRKRKHRHRRETIAALERVLAESRADHICMTGDITNLGLAREFQTADGWLRGRAGPEAMTFVPGNHDAYVTAARESMKTGMHRWLPDSFPSVARRDGVIFIGVSSAVATPPFLATGRIGDEQLERLAAILHGTRRDGCLRILLIHHPPADGIVGRRKRLTDGDGLRRLLSARPVDLVLHGHGHRAVQYTLESERGPIPVFGAGSASLSNPDPARSGHFHLFELDDGLLQVTHYRYSPEEARYAAAGPAQVVVDRS